MSDKLVYKIIEYLNQVAGTDYSPSYPDTVNLVNNLLSLGYGMEDFKTVIDKKNEQWRGTKYKQYLRPSTLFGSNFENYLNEPRITKKSNVQQLAESVQRAKNHKWNM